MVRRRLLFGTFSALALCAGRLVSRAYAAPGCSDDEFYPRLWAMTDWKSIYSGFKRTVPICGDAGTYAEGYSTVIVHAFARDWKQLLELQNLLASDSEFRTFVFHHIDATANRTDLELTLENANKQCPVGASTLCKEIAASASAAIKNYDMFWTAL